ncbi:ROK family protein [Paenibacillus oleatilyticus]|uniref:ROK family protein n=1 Tax=Paenibacillus oleatilyticus TaxID=2594886 RepID=UPI001C1FD8C2|nr:ROK family protein [Paenibacillus oleatilyticus]MBU7316600.1 ROK family protein [Paenibacillus oleatilyticus]
MNIAIDFGGTTIKIGLVHEGKVHALRTLPAHSSKGLIPRLPAVAAAVRELLACHRLSIADCEGIGIATPGLVDTVNRTIVSINDKYSDAVGFSFQAWIADTFQLPFVMENDARSALIGETAYGVAQRETDAVLMTFGTGIGTAAMMNGKILHGRHYQAGILGGHLSTDIHGSLCNCGNIGCLEAQAGHWALNQAARRHPHYSQSRLSQLTQLSYLAVLEEALSGDQAATDLLEHLISHWIAGIVNLIHAYDPEVVILSGGLMKSKDHIVPLLSERVCKNAWTPWGKVRIAVAEDPDASVLLGVSRLLSEHTA